MTEQRGRLCAASDHNGDGNADPPGLLGADLQRRRPPGSGDGRPGRYTRPPGCTDRCGSNGLGNPQVGKDEVELGDFQDLRANLPREVLALCRE